MAARRLETWRGVKKASTTRLDLDGMAFASPGICRPDLVTGPGNVETRARDWCRIWGSSRVTVVTTNKVRNWMIFVTIIVIKNRAGHSFLFQLCHLVVSFFSIGGARVIFSIGGARVRVGGAVFVVWLFITPAVIVWIVITWIIIFVQVVALEIIFVDSQIIVVGQRIVVNGRIIPELIIVPLVTPKNW